MSELDSKQARAARVNFSVSMSEALRDRLQDKADAEGHGSRSQTIMRYCAEGLDRDAAADK